MKLTSLPPSMRHDSTAWCSVFANAGFELNGYKGTDSADAASWLDWGHDVGSVWGDRLSLPGPEVTTSLSCRGT